jgi:hypothetical protein
VAGAVLHVAVRGRHLFGGALVGDSSASDDDREHEQRGLHGRDPIG